MTYKEQRPLIIAACEKAGACKKEFRRLKRTRSERTFFAVIRDNAGWAINNLPAYLPDGTYGREGYLLFGVADSKLHGECTEWRENGNLWIHCHCQNGELHGECKWWNQGGTNGNLWIHCHYQHDQLHGEYREWEADGNLWKHAHYHNGKLHGEYREWDSEGNLREQCHYEQGQLHGECKWWDWDGTLEEHCHYEQGVEVKGYLA